MTMVWLVIAALGMGLTIWSALSLPPGTSEWPKPIEQRATRGPYLWLRHPMYVGNVAFITGCAGAAAGWLNALAVGTVAELLMREWAAREDQR